MSDSTSSDHPSEYAMTAEESAHLEYVKSKWIPEIAYAKIVSPDGPREIWEKRYYRDIPFLVALIDKQAGAALSANRLQAYIADIGKILTGAMGSDLGKVALYGQHLCEKLDQAGEYDAAKHLRQIIMGESAPTDDAPQEDEILKSA